MNLEEIERTKNNSHMLFSTRKNLQRSSSEWTKSAQDTFSIQKDKLWVHETPILEEVFVTLTENSSVATNDTQGPKEFPNQRK